MGGEPVWAHTGVWVGTTFESDGDGVGAAVGDCPAKHVLLGRGGEELFGEEVVERMVTAGENGEIL